MTHDELMAMPHDELVALYEALAAAYGGLTTPLGVSSSEPVFATPVEPEPVEPEPEP